MDDRNIWVGKAADTMTKDVGAAPDHLPRADRARIAVVRRSEGRNAPTALCIGGEQAIGHLVERTS